MSSVLQFTHPLPERSQVPALEGVALRTYAGSEDIALWLQIRRQAFARQPVGVRDWDRGDFEREFLSKPWWRPERMWFAQIEQPGELEPLPVGTVTLARRGEGPHAKPVVHWLAVVGRYRRRGIGRLLMATLEAAVWDEGGRQVWLETHSRWSEAVRLYEQLGYDRVAPESASG